MKSVLIAFPLWGLWLSGCAGPVPYRDGTLGFDASCASTYAAYDSVTPAKRFLSKTEAEQRCWRRSVEEHRSFDLLFSEFSDQGWVQGTSELSRPAKDYFDSFADKLKELHAAYERHKDYNGLSIVVYVHGWHHNALASDQDVESFRRFLGDMAALETALSPHPQKKPRRVIGIYVGWRGESVEIPILNELTFWDRKNTAERVALGTVRELFARLDYFRDRSRDKDGNRDVRMLTIGHSFGGLVTYASMAGEFLRNAVRYKECRPGNQVDKFMSRVGDMVVLVNPAFEGARFEPLHTAGQRIAEFEPNQLPVLVVATSTADWATRIAFPMARQFSTFLERSSGSEGDAVVMAVGHNDRYITHDLSTCSSANETCANACIAQPAAAPKPVGSLSAADIRTEMAHMVPFTQSGIPVTAYFCGGLQLRATRQWHPKNNPFWVVRTTKEVINDHGDVFNPNFVGFFRQLYIGFIYARMHTTDDGRGPCN
jgi:hypothetical protein